MSEALLKLIKLLEIPAISDREHNAKDNHQQTVPRRNRKKSSFSEYKGLDFVELLQR
jgi:hypothetical protein